LRGRRTRSVLALVGIVLVVGLVWSTRQGQGGSDPDTPVGTVAIASLPPEAALVARAIHAGGPFRYDRDGAVFGNREGLLPPQRRGFYREYTVPTPGSSDRGARRIVAGADGTLYWSDDHYASFRVIRE
jgi:ribonuclease T1